MRTYLRRDIGQIAPASSRLHIAARILQRHRRKLKLIAKVCGVSETAVRKWIGQEKISVASPKSKLKPEIPLATVQRLRALPETPPPTSKERLSEERVGRIVSKIGKAANVSLSSRRMKRVGKRTKFASSHDIVVVVQGG